MRTYIRGNLVAAIALLAMMNVLAPDFAAAQGPFDQTPTDTTIFAPDGGKVIGHGHYGVSFVDGLDVLAGENKYLDGEFDREEERLKPSADDLPPVLVSYRHRYFNADGSPQFEEALDPRTGDGTCKSYNSNVPDIQETTLTVPADTYAGASQLMLLVGRLRQAAPRITLHSFNCIPEPRIVAVKAVPVTDSIEWQMHPGKLLKMEMEPDLGFLNVLIAPFIPKVAAWFDPSDSFNYVGGQFDRYYKGRHVMMVRSHDSNPVAQGSTKAPSQP